MRLLGRWKTSKRLYYDDAFIVFAWLMMLATAIDWQIISGLMYQFRSVVGGQVWPPPSTFVQDTQNFFKGSLAALIFFYTGLWAVKLSFLFFFKRLGHNVQQQKLIWWPVFTLTVATYVVCIGDIQYGCLVVPLTELYKKCTTESSIDYERATLKANCILDVMTDFLSQSVPPK